MSRKRTREHRIWSAQVIRRDKRCVICGSIKNRQAHHINDYSNFPEIRYDLENGVCLCGVTGCHTQFHCNYKKNFRQKCTEDDFVNFFDLMMYAKETFNANVQGNSDGDSVQHVCNCSSEGCCRSATEDTPGMV